MQIPRFNIGVKVYNHNDREEDMVYRVQYCGFETTSGNCLGCDGYYYKLYGSFKTVCGKLLDTPNAVKGFTSGTRKFL